MIRKTFKYNIELPINDSSRTVETEWTVDLKGDKVIDLEIVSCDGDLDERQYDRLKEICMAMRNMPALKMEIIDEGTPLWAIDIEPEHWNEYIALSNFGEL